MGTGAQPPIHQALAIADRPVLFAIGEEDSKFAGIAHDLAARMAHAQVAVVPESGHAAHLENLAAFADVTEAFLSQERSGQ